MTEPAVLHHGRRPLRIALVAVEQHRPAQQHLVVLADPDLDAVERDAVVHAAAAGLAHPVGLHDPDARGARPRPAPRRRAGRRRPGPRRSGARSLDVGAVLERAEELGRHQRDVGRARSARGPHDRRRTPARSRPPPTGRAPAPPRRTSAAGSAPTGPGRRAARGSPAPRRASRRGRAPPASASRSNPEVAITSGSGSSAASHSRSSSRISSAVPQTGRRLLTGPR